MKRGLIIDPRDNVGIVLEQVYPGDVIDFGDLKITAIEEISLPHKVALKDFAVDDYVYKYGEVIGYITAEAPRGSHIHVHNLDSERLMK